MTVTDPQTGDIWVYKKGDLEPLTLLIGELLETGRGYTKFRCTPLDFPRMDHVSFNYWEMKHWRKVA